MKLMLCTLLFSACACLAGPTEIKEAADLIETLPAREKVVADVALFKKKEVNPEKFTEEQRQANERLTKAAAGFARLKTLLRPNTSVSDYPGLRRLAQVLNMSDDGRTYSLIIGIAPGWRFIQPEGTNPEEFRLVINDGTITAINPVIYLH